MFIPYLLIILSLAGIIVLVLKKMPVLVKISSEPVAGQPEERLAAKTINLIRDKIAHPGYWLAFLNWLEKSLRRTRIIFLKLDNFFVSLIARSRQSSQEFTIKSRDWVSGRRMQKIEKLKLLSDLRRTAEEKEEMFLSILRQNPKDIKAYKELGALYLEQENYQDALAAFEEVLKINFEDEAAAAGLEEIRRKQEGSDEAKK